MLCTGAQTIQYFVPTLIGALGWTGYDGQYHTIPLYACAFVCILVFCFSADRTQKKPLFIMIASGLGMVFFIIVTAVTNHMVQYVFIILAFGMVYALPPLILTWVPNVISQPAEKRAVAIALVNALGNSASIYGVFLWPSTDAPSHHRLHVPHLLVHPDRVLPLPQAPDRAGRPRRRCPRRDQSSARKGLPGVRVERALSTCGG
jgi:MFS family permease